MWKPKYLIPLLLILIPTIYASVLHHFPVVKHCIDDECEASNGRCLNGICRCANEVFQVRDDCAKLIADEFHTETGFALFYMSLLHFPLFFLVCITLIYRLRTEKFTLNLYNVAYLMLGTVGLCKINSFIHTFFDVDSSLF